MVSAVMSRSAGKDDFIAGLHEQNIDLILRYTDEGRIYGATFIDHNTKTVLNGSRLGKAFSANALDRWFNNSEDKPISPVNEQEQPERNSHQDSGDGQATAQPHEKPQIRIVPPQLTGIYQTTMTSQFPGWIYFSKVRVSIRMRKNSSVA